MPNSKQHLSVKLNLLKPQSNPEKLPVKFFFWLLSTGRYIFVLVEAIVLIAFFARFKLDADLATKKTAIEEQVAYIASLKPYEVLIRNTQLKLTTISDVKKNSQDWSVILKKIASQTPINTLIIGINIEKATGRSTIHINAQTQNNNDITSFILGLKEDSTFNSVGLSSVSLDQGVIKYAIDLSANPGAGGT